MLKVKRELPPERVPLAKKEEQGQTGPPATGSTNHPKRHRETTRNKEEKQGLPIVAT